jgi:chromosome partitioning protein
MIISLVNQKGGVGKTTLATNVSDCISAKGLRVLLVDTDPQGSVVQWQAINANTGFDVRHHPMPVSWSDIRRWAGDYDHLVIDAPPALGDITRSILALSDLAIVPIGPSPLDIWSSNETVMLIREAQRKNRNLEGGLLICRKIPRTRIGREARDAMEDYDMAVFQTEVSQRIAYVQAMLAGVTVITYAPRSDAASEMRNLCDEILSWVLEGKGLRLETRGKS